MKEMARQTVHTLIRKMAGEPYRQGICIVEGHMVTKNSVKARKIQVSAGKTAGIAEV